MTYASFLAANAVPIAECQASFALNVCLCTAGGVSNVRRLPKNPISLSELTLFDMRA
jgi:hypothetical protein